MKHKNVLYHLHHRGIPTSFYERFPKLNEYFNILSTNYFVNDTIVSTCEAKRYPIYLTQYHPEIVYEPAEDIKANREIDSFKIAFNFASFFAEECSKNSHKFVDNETLQRHLVKNGAKAQIQYI